jgi:CubicO group peptidase (beta-lactamase class C family)
MTLLRDLLETTVESGRVPGAAALVAHGEHVEIAGVGEVGPESIVRIASITKPITAAAIMILVDEGLVALDEPIAWWLPELASPRVVRTIQSTIDDVVPAARPITVEDVMTFRAGWGFPSDFSLPEEQRQASTLFLEGAGWGFGGAVTTDGRYGWIGGTGTTAHVAPSTGTIGILLTQLQMTGPTSTQFMREFWRYAFGAF